MEIKMYVRKCIITRPNTDVIFRPDSPNIWSIICKYLDDGKLLYRGVDFSEDGLTRIDTYIFNSKDDCTAMLSEPLVIDYVTNILPSWFANNSSHTRTQEEEEI